MKMPPKGKGKQKIDVETTPAEENSIENLRKELSQVKKIQEVTNSVFADMRKEISSVGGKVNNLMECISEEVNSMVSKAVTKAVLDNGGIAAEAMKKHWASHLLGIANEQVEMNEAQNLLKQEIKSLEAQLAASRNCLEDQDKRIMNVERMWQEEKQKHDQSSKDDFENLKDLVAKLETGMDELRKNSAVAPQILSSAPNEFHLRERKKNNLIIFGLGESNEAPNEEVVDDLFHDLGTVITSDEYQCFRVGKYNSQNYRPLVIKLPNAIIKSDILAKAKMLRGNEKWKGVSITHDLTKMQCAEEKTNELLLRQEAVKRNEGLSPEEKLTKFGKLLVDVDQELWLFGLFNHNRSGPYSSTTTTITEMTMTFFFSTN